MGPLAVSLVQMGRGVWPIQAPQLHQTSADNLSRVYVKKMEGLLQGQNPHYVLYRDLTSTALVDCLFLK